MEAQTHLENLAIRALNQFISHASIVGRFVIHFGKSSSAIASGAPPTAPIGARISEGDNRLGIRERLDAWPQVDFDASSQSRRDRAARHGW